MSDSCIACGSPATRLCDFKIGAPIGGYSRVGRIEDNRFHAVMSLDRQMFSCDAPICDKCSTNKGMIHASGNGGFSETVDYCPCHAESGETKVMPMTDEEADKIKRGIIAYYKRKVIKSVEAVERFTAESNFS